MTRPQDYFGASPKSVLNKPFLHVQDQKAYNVDGGTSIADAWTKRTLNTVITNDIQGASLASDQVSLPAGTYYVEGSGEHINNGGGSSSFIASIFKDGVRSLTGSTSFAGNGTQGKHAVAGVVTLSSPGIIELRYQAGLATATSGLGYSNNIGSIVDTSLSSIYADLKIWQLDRSLEIAPKAINSGLQTIAGMNTEGNIMGFDVTVSGNTLTITKGSCMSSDLTVPLAFTTDKTRVLPATVNGDFYVFAVRLLDGVTYEARAYSTYAGPSSDAQIDKWRFLSFAKNNGSGVTMPYRQVGDTVEFISTDMPVITSSTTSSFVLYPISTVVPVGLIEKLVIVCDPAISTTLNYSYGGTSVDLSVYNALMAGYVEILSVAGIYIKSGASTYQKVRRITLRR